MFTVVSTVLVAASSHDLTDLATIKTELELASDDTGKDAWLEAAISQASKAVENYCNRVFAVERVQDIAYVRRDYRWHHWNGYRETELFQLSRFPVNAVTAVTGSDVASGAVLPIGSTTGISVGDPASGLNIPPGRSVQSIMANVSVTLSGNVGGAVPQGTPITFGLAVSQNDPGGSTPRALILGEDYALDAGSGQLIRLGANSGQPQQWEALQLTAAYSAGYPTIEDDIVEAVLRLLTLRFKARGRDPALRERDQGAGLGRETYWVGGPPKSGSMPEDVAAILDGYRVLRIS